MVVFPNCKINLGLHVTAKRPDGYHDLETCFFPVGWQDVLEILPAEHLSFRCSGIAIPGDNTDNLCLKAYHLLAADYTLPPAEIILHKAIPIGAGLGGGSADASFTLKALNDRFELGASPEQLEAYALQLGSDCPFFIRNKPVIARGRGEIFEPVTLELPGYYFLLVNPGFHVSTGQAYAGVKPKAPARALSEVLAQPISTWREELVNDFEASVFSAFPAIAEWKERLYSMGAAYACMSGSGATVFGIFEKKPELEVVIASGLSYHLQAPA